MRNLKASFLCLASLFVLVLLFQSCIKEEVIDLGDDPLKLQLVLDANGTQFLEWQPLKISNFKSYTIEVSPDHTFANFTEADTILFNYTDSSAKVNLNRLPFSRYQYFRVVASNIYDHKVFSKSVEAINADVFNIPFNDLAEFFYISPDSRFIVTQNSSSFSCIDLEAEKVTGQVYLPNGISFSRNKFCFSQKNGESFFHIIANQSTAQLTTYKLPELQEVGNSVLNIANYSQFAVIDETDFLVTYSADAWPYSLKLVNIKTGAIRDELETSAWLQSHQYQTFHVTDISNQEFVHVRADSTIKYRITPDNKLEYIKGIQASYPTFSTDDRVLQEYKEGQFFAPFVYAGIHRNDLSVNFSNPDLIQTFLYSFLHRCLSLDGKSQFTLFHNNSTQTAQIVKYDLESMQLLYDKSYINQSSLGIRPFLVDRPNGLYFGTIQNTQLILRKIEQ